MEGGRDSRWVPFTTDRRGLGGFAALLAETLAAAEVASRLLYEGYQWYGTSPVSVLLSISSDPFVPGFLGVLVDTFDDTVDGAIQAVDRHGLRQVNSQLIDRLVHSAYKYLPRAMGEYRAHDADQELYRRTVMEDPDPRLRLVSRCLHLQDQELLKMDRSMNRMRSCCNDHCWQL